MFRLVPGTNSFYLFANIILVPVPPFPINLFLQPSLLPLLIHHPAQPQIPLSFTPGLKPTFFTNPNPRSFISSSRTAFTDCYPDRFFWAARFLVLVFRYYFVSVQCARLGWPSRQLLSARKFTVSYRGVYIRCRQRWDSTRSRRGLGTKCAAVLVALARFV